MTNYSDNMLVKKSLLNNNNLYTTERRYYQKTIKILMKNEQLIINQGIDKIN